MQVRFGTFVLDPETRELLRDGQCAAVAQSVRPAEHPHRRPAEGDIQE